MNRKAMYTILRPLEERQDVSLLNTHPPEPCAHRHNFAASNVIFICLADVYPIFLPVWNPRGINALTRPWPAHLQHGGSCICPQYNLHMKSVCCVTAVLPSTTRESNYQLHLCEPHLFQ